MISKSSNSAILRYLVNSAHELGEKEEELNRKEEELTASYKQIKDKVGDYREELSFSHKWFLAASALIFIAGLLIGHFLV